MIEALLILIVVGMMSMRNCSHTHEHTLDCNEDTCDTYYDSSLDYLARDSSEEDSND